MPKRWCVFLSRLQWFFSSLSISASLSFFWSLSLRRNVLLSQNKRLGGLWIFVIRIIKLFYLISNFSLTFHVLHFSCVSLHCRQPPALYIFFSFHSMQNPFQSYSVSAWRWRNMGRVWGYLFISQWKSLNGFFTHGWHLRGLQYNNVVVVILFEKAAL